MARQGDKSMDYSVSSECEELAERDRAAIFGEKQRAVDHALDVGLMHLTP